jgi:glycosyltransferase involved in cell wall biosynthesis
VSASSVAGRVLLFIESGGAGGAERVVVRLAGALRERGVDAGVMTTRTGWLSETLTGRGIPHQRIDAGRSLDATYPFRLARRLRAARVDVLHSHLLDSNFYGALAARIAGVRHVATEHGDVHHTQPKKLLRTKVRTLSALRSQLTAVSGFTVDALVRLGARRRRIAHIGNPVDPAPPLDASTRKELRASLGVADAAAHHWLWVHVANHRPVKDQATLLRGFALARRASPLRQTLCLVGDGPERARLEALARELDLGADVRFLGFRDDVGRWLRAADGFVLSSRSEAMPMSLLEACLADLLPVSTAVGGVGEVVEDGVTGFLVEPGSPESMARALAGALADVEASAHLARAARARVETRFSVDAVVGAYLELYRL